MIPPSLDVVLRSWTDFLNMEENARRRNVQRLVDYYNGQHIPYLRKYLRFDKEELDDFPYYYTNLTRRIIKRISHVYKNPPVRYFGDQQSDKYNDLTRYKNFRMKTIERQVNLLGVIGVRPVYNEDQKAFKYIILRDFQAFFGDNPLEPIAIRYIISGSDKLHPVYEYWDEEKVLRLSAENKVLHQEENPYGVIPFVWLNCEDVIDDFWNNFGNADDLVMANEQINLMLSEMSHKYRFKSFDPIYIAGDADDSEVLFSYNRALKIPPGATAGTIGGEHNFLQDIELIKFNIQLIERNYNLSINWGIEGAPSGFSLVVQNIDHFDDLEDKREIARFWEQRLFDMEKIVAKAHGIGGLPDKPLRVNFAEIQLPLSQQEKNLKWAFEFEHGLASKADYIRAHNPDISDAEIEEKLKSIAEEKKKLTELGRTEPTIRELLG